MKKLMAVLLIGSLLWPLSAAAQTPSSPNFSVPESSFNSGSNIDANSANFNSRVSFGDLAVGVGRSTNFSARPGFITPDEEFLELVVQTPAVDLGTLSTSTTGSGSAIFYVRSYINGDYVVSSNSPPPESVSGSQLDPISSAAASTQGTEQFGMNLVANTSPVVIGANPAPQPDGTFANGTAATGYDTSDVYQYNQNDIIARSGAVGEAWGQTNYTISYIANISGITEAGTYVMEQDIVVTATF